jgi:hypothetical protein
MPLTLIITVYVVAMRLAMSVPECYLAPPLILVLVICRIFAKVAPFGVGPGAMHVWNRCKMGLLVQPVIKVMHRTLTLSIVIYYIYG